MEDIKRKYELVKSVVQERVDKQGRNRCWYYPDLFNRLIEIFEINPTENLLLPPKKEFEEGCKRY